MTSVHTFVSWVKGRVKPSKRKDRLDAVDEGDSGRRRHMTPVTRSAPDITIQTSSQQQPLDRNICRASMKLPPVPKYLNGWSTPVGARIYAESPSHMYEEIPEGYYRVQHRNYHLAGDPRGEAVPYMVVPLDAIIHRDQYYSRDGLPAGPQTEETYSHGQENVGYPCRTSDLLQDHHVHHQHYDMYHQGDFIPREVESFKYLHANLPDTRQQDAGHTKLHHIVSESPCDEDGYLQYRSQELHHHRHHPLGHDRRPWCGRDSVLDHHSADELIHHEHHHRSYWSDGDGPDGVLESSHRDTSSRENTCERDIQSECSFGGSERGYDEVLNKIQNNLKMKHDIRKLVQETDSSDCDSSNTNRNEATSKCGAAAFKTSSSLPKLTADKSAFKPPLSRSRRSTKSRSPKQQHNPGRGVGLELSPAVQSTVECYEIPDTDIESDVERLSCRVTNLQPHHIKRQYVRRSSTGSPSPQYGSCGSLRPTTQNRLLDDLLRFNYDRQVVRF
jgi:hypothetical protein